MKLHEYETDNKGDVSFFGDRILQTYNGERDWLILGRGNDYGNEESLGYSSFDDLVLYKTQDSLYVIVLVSTFDTNGGNRVILHFRNSLEEVYRDICHKHLDGGDLPDWVEYFCRDVGIPTD